MVVTGRVYEGRVDGIGFLSVAGRGCSTLVDEDGLIEVAGRLEEAADGRVDVVGRVGAVEDGRVEVVGRVTVEGLVADTLTPDEGLVTVVDGRLAEAGATCLPWFTGLVPGRVAGVPVRTEVWEDERVAVDEEREVVDEDERVAVDEEREVVDEDEREVDLL